MIYYVLLRRQTGIIVEQIRRISAVFSIYESKLKVDSVVQLATIAKLAHH